MKNTKIQWCDHTFNPWIGCTKVSVGCAHCYAERLDKRFGHDCFGKGKPRRRTSAANWRMPVKWNRDAICASCDNVLDLSKLAPDETIICGRCSRSNPRRPRVFCGSMCDWLDDEVPIEWIADLLELIALTPSLDWLLLTKRPENWERRIHECAQFIHVAGFAADWGLGYTPANVWVGTTVENQEMADKRISALLQIPAKVRFLSCEPLLSAVDIRAGVKRPEGTRGYFDWVICGGESGPNARPMHPDWARSLRDQCAAAGVPFLFKQCGEWASQENRNGKHWRRLKKDFLPWDGEFMVRIGKKAAGRLLDGVEHNEFPL